jgi:hypothetical protein
LAVNNVTRGNSRSVWMPLKHSKAWAWTEHPSTVKLVGVLQLGVCGRNSRLLHFWGSNSFGRKCQWATPLNVHISQVWGLLTWVSSTNVV